MHATLDVLRRRYARRLPSIQGMQRIGWVVVDQSLSSVINMVLAITVARATTPDEFGTFTLAFAIYVIALGLSRAISSDPLTVRYSTVLRDDWEGAVAVASGAAIAVGAGVAVLLFMGSWLFTPNLQYGLLALAVGLPGLLAHSVWRFAFFTVRRPRHALAADATFAALLLCLFGILVARGSSQAGDFIAAWGLAASIAVATVALLRGVRPTFKAIPSWLTSHRDLSPSFVGEFVVSNGILQLMTVLVAALGGLAAAGAIRGAQVLFGPVSVVIMATVATAIPEGVRLRRKSSTALSSGMVFVSVCVTLVALGWGFVTGVLLPEGVGRAILGDTWAAAAAVVPALTLLLAATGAGLGAVSGLRVLEQPKRSLVVRCAIAPLALAGGVAGTLIAGAPGAVWGQAGPMALAAGVWWLQFERARH